MKINSKHSLKELPSQVAKAAILSALLAVIPIAFVAYQTGSAILSIIFVYLPIMAILTLLYKSIEYLLTLIDEKNATIDSMRSQISILNNELDVLKHVAQSKQLYEKRHSIFKEFVKELGNTTTPEDIIHILEEFLHRHFQGVKGFSILIRGKQALSPAPLIRKGDTSPPQIKLEIPGRDNIFYVHIGYIPGYVYSHEIEDILELFSLALKKWEDLKGSITDPLTGAYNRQFLELIRDYIEDENSQYTLLMIDLDGFKKVNDSMGHEKGDEILKNTVQKIQNSLRGNDILIRYGGDEFVVIASDTTMENGLRVAERIRLSVRNNLISASIGAVFKRRGVKAKLEKIIKLADALMYIAKKEKDKVVGGKWEGSFPSQK
ncbi:diguanylate cyclase [bacterium 3DAC]|nr:diguanylate cyclase [bacterium 3DAC]